MFIRNANAKQLYYTEVRMLKSGSNGEHVPPLPHEGPHLHGMEIQYRFGKNEHFVGSKTALFCPTLVRRVQYPMQYVQGAKLQRVIGFLSESYP